jgi:hypothetical protein
MLFLIESGNVGSAIVGHGLTLADLSDQFCEEVGRLLSIGGVSVYTTTDDLRETKVSFSSTGNTMHEKVSYLKQYMMSGCVSRFRFNNIVLTIQNYKL